MGAYDIVTLVTLVAIAACGTVGVSVVHAASCPCLKPRNYTIEDLVTTNRFPDIRDYICVEGR